MCGAHVRNAVRSSSFTSSLVALTASASRCGRVAAVLGFRRPGLRYSKPRSTPAPFERVGVSPSAKFVQVASPAVRLVGQGSPSSGIRGSASSAWSAAPRASSVTIAEQQRHGLVLAAEEGLRRRRRQVAGGADHPGTR